MSYGQVSPLTFILLVIRLFLDPATAAKVNFLDKDYKERLLELIDHSQLLEKYGGDLVNFTEQPDWEGEIVLHPVLEEMEDSKLVIEDVDDEYVMVERILEALNGDSEVLKDQAMMSEPTDILMVGEFSPRPAIEPPSYAPVLTESPKSASVPPSPVFYCLLICRMYAT
jgi:hypothetical protein